MATSLLLKASDQISTHDKTMKALCDSEETKTESRRNRCRRANGKDPNQKKQPQRGLGVAQLERLRLQESWKKMTETSELPPLPVQHHKLLQCRPPLLPFMVTDPFGSVPVHYVAAANHGTLQDPPSVINGNTVAILSQGQTVGNRSGFNVLGGGGDSTDMGGWLMPSQVNMVESHGIGTPFWSPFVGSPLETSKELSSIPNVHSESKRCDVCVKKKRFNEDSVKASNTRRDRPSDIWPINGTDFFGFSPLQAPNLNGETNNITAKATRHATRNLDEVVAVHRKGNPMNDRLFMEYEFFPVKYGRGAPSKELELPAVASVAGASSSITAIAYGDSTASNSIDLSLKLSY